MSKLLGHLDIKTSMINAKAGETIKRRAIEKLEDESHDGHKMVTFGVSTSKLDDGPKDEK